MLKNCLSIGIYHPDEPDRDYISTRKSQKFAFSCAAAIFLHTTVNDVNQVVTGKFFFFFSYVVIFPVQDQQICQFCHSIKVPIGNDAR